MPQQVPLNVQFIHYCVDIAKRIAERVIVSELKQQEKFLYVELSGYAIWTKYKKNQSVLNNSYL